MIQTSNLVYAYDDQHSFQFPDLNLKEGEDLLVLGPSGVGKTTFMHLLAGLLPAKEGAVNINQIALSGLSRKKLDEFRGQHIGIVFQKSKFISALSVDENLQLKQFFAHKKSKKEKREELLIRLGIEDQAGKKTHQLSEGQKQRVSIALALINEPAVILADEPTASLDDPNCYKVMKLLKQEAENYNANLVIITHDQRAKEVFTNHIVL